jgi:hypothetical protein
MDFISENGAKSRNGGRLQKLFTEATGIETAKEETKATFVNIHGDVELIDYDFFLQIDGIDVLIDVTTTYRLCRCKQKYYSGLLYRMYVPRPSFYIVAVEDFEDKTPVVKHGADLLIDTQTLIDHINNGTLSEVIHTKLDSYELNGKTNIVRGVI